MWYKCSNDFDALDLLRNKLKHSTNLVNSNSFIMHEFIKCLRHLETDVLGVYTAYIQSKDVF